MTKMRDPKLVEKRREKRYINNKPRIDYYFSLYTSGMSINEIASREGISKQRIFQLLKQHPCYETKNNRNSV